jgi:hypothetical protein
MANQTITKPLSLIKDLKILIHGIPYAVTFTMIQNGVLDSSYSMLLGCPWLRDAKLSHDWGNNIIIIQRNGTIRTIPLTKKLGAPTKCLKALVCYDFHFGISNEEEDLMFAKEPRLFSIGIIVVLTLVGVDQVIKHVELVFEALISSNIPIKSVHV